MRYFFLLFCTVLILYSCQNTTQDETQIKVNGLTSSVEIIRDQWGINHIYAGNQNDLFFAQGYAAAKDRLFQFEIWRRQSLGTVSELLGPEELPRDVGTRLFKFRGDLTTEFSYYHPEGKAIIEAYVSGVNAYINEINLTPELLPLPFKMLGTTPQLWTPEVVISRHQGLLGNIGEELNIGRAVALLGAETVKSLLWFHPQNPKLELDKEIDTSLLFEDLLAPYFAFRKTVKFKPEHLLEEYRVTASAGVFFDEFNDLSKDSLAIGSNNWVVAGSKTIDGHTYMANDPHRTVAVPSLRYMAHLVAPGWNVIGGGEPEIPGISIGHNEYGAWGLTVFRTDGEDLYQYELNPNNPNQYKFNGSWRNFEIIKERIPVKESDSIDVELYYSHHGPVTYRNEKALKAFAVRCAWLEPGGSPYLASLRMDQAENWDAFREACTYSHIPGENMIWADREGTIGWQAVGIAPIRNSSSGLVPVPGDGRYDWGGYLPIAEKPHAVNPKKGFIATANQNVTPAEYPHWNAIGYSWSDPYRGDRVNEVLEPNNALTLEDMRALQVDVLSLPARTLVPYLASLSFDSSIEQHAQNLLAWDYQLLTEAVPAALYVRWEEEIMRRAEEEFIPNIAKKYISSLQLKRIIDWIQSPKNSPFKTEKYRNTFLKETFESALLLLKNQLGDDPKEWRYGQAKFKHTALTHVLGGITTPEMAKKLNLGPLPRGGNAYTPGSTGKNDRQSSGASFRIIVNTGDWDAAIGTNTPGQSGDPESPFYQNLFKDWAEDRYFPIYYSREKIEAHQFSKTILVP